MRRVTDLVIEMDMSFHWEADCWLAAYNGRISQLS